MTTAPVAGQIALLTAPSPGLARFSVDGLKQRPRSAGVIGSRLRRLPGVRRVEPNPLTGHVLVVFDADRWSSQALLEASGQTLSLLPGQPDPRPARTDLPSNGGVPGRVRLSVDGLWQRPAREGDVEQRFRHIPGVRSARASAWTGRALVQFDPQQCSLERLMGVATSFAWAGDQADGQRINGIQEPPSEPWHAMEPEDVAALQGVAVAEGLDQQEVASRRRKTGGNSLPKPREPSLGDLAAHQLANAPTVLLVASAGMSLFTGGLVQAGLVLAVVGINAVLGATTERHGSRAIAALRSSPRGAVRVRRDGVDSAVQVEDLVPGDIVQLNAGDMVPADARIVECEALSVEESALTGESRPVDKSAAPVSLQSPLGDRSCMVYGGTTIMNGRGQAVVVATGTRTVIGQVHLLASEAEAPPTPMERELARLGRLLAVGVGAITLGVAALNIWRGVPVLGALQVAIALGVAAIPEGLTALATSVLALASGRLRRKGTLIRSLAAAEALGAVTVVCADKTGTITENRMVATELYAAGARFSLREDQATGAFVEREGALVSLARCPEVGMALEIGVLCSDAEVRLAPSGDVQVQGSATEGALQLAAAGAGLEPWSLRDRHPRSGVLYRSESRRHMLTVHRLDEETVALVKGSPEEVLGLCSRALAPDGEVPLSRVLRSAIAGVNADMAGRAMRVLGLARRSVPDGYQQSDLEEGFTFMGLIGLVDPVRPSAAEAVRALRTAGIRTVMITGDQALTAVAVAREIGLAEGDTLRVLEAGDLVGLEPEALAGLVRNVHVFARISPAMKLAIVRALQANGEVVAMSGDGVNDGPALRAADVGIAMGERGTELARELADVVLSRDDLSQIAGAVEEGRLVRANVRRVLHYLLATNMSEVALVTAAVAGGMAEPLSPLQLLWLNLVTDLAPGLGLAVEPRDPDLMRRPPEDPKRPILSVDHLRTLGLESTAIAAGALGAYGFGLARYGPAAAGSMAFATLMTAQLLHVNLARTGDAPVLGRTMPKNTPLRLGIAVAALLQGVALFVPAVRAALGGVAISRLGWAVVLAGAYAPLAAIEGVRQARLRLRSAPAPSDTRKEAPYLG